MCLSYCRENSKISVNRTIINYLICNKRKKNYSVQNFATWTHPAGLLTSLATIVKLTPI